MFIPIERQTWIQKIAEKQVFAMQPRHQNHLSQRGECDYGAQLSKERRLLCESMFTLIQKWNSNLKTVEREVFLVKPMHQKPLLQQGECVYSAQSWNERTLLCESMFILIGRWTSILKIVERQVFLM